MPMSGTIIEPTKRYKRLGLSAHENHSQVDVKGPTFMPSIWGRMMIGVMIGRARARIVPGAKALQLRALGARRTAAWHTMWRMHDPCQG